MLYGPTVKSQRHADWLTEHNKTRGKLLLQVF